MSSSVKLSEHIIAIAKIKSKAMNCSIAEQIEYWAKIGRIIEDNPDLTYDTIKKILSAQQEALAGEESSMMVISYKTIVNL